MFILARKLEQNKARIIRLAMDGRNPLLLVNITQDTATHLEVDYQDTCYLYWASRNSLLERIGCDGTGRKVCNVFFTSITTFLS